MAPFLMPSYAHFDCDRLTFLGTDGLLYELRGLPLAKRDLFVVQWSKWRAMAGDVADLPDFVERYDRLLIDGSPNPNHDAEFRRLTEWLLRYLVAYDTIDGTQRKLLDLVDAATVVGLLLSKDGGPSVVEALEFPARKEGDKPGKPLPDGVDPTAHSLAVLMSYCDGDVVKALEMAQTLPHGELMAILDEHNRLMDEAQRQAKGKDKDSIWATADDGPAQKDDDWGKLTEDDFRQLAEEFKADQLAIISGAGAIAHES